MIVPFDCALRLCSGQAQGTVLAERSRSQTPQVYSFPEIALEVTAKVLSQHIQSEAEISDILAEIRSQTSL